MKLFIQENLWVAGWLGGAVKSHLVRSTIQGFASHCVTRAVLTHDVMYTEFFLKISYVSLIYKCSIVLKIFTEPFLSCTLPQRGEISNISNRQTKSA